MRGGRPGDRHLVSSLGVTGVGGGTETNLASMIKAVRENTDLPCAVSFDLSAPEEAPKMAALSDGVIIDSAVVRLLERYGREAAPHVGAYVRMMKQALC